MGRLGLEHIADDITDQVPDNLLPMGFRAFQDPDMAQVYPLVGRSTEGALITVEITAEAVRNFGFSDGAFDVRMGSEQSRIPIATIDVADALLGPPVPKVEGVFRERPAEITKRAGATLSVLGLIDTGIAFWNPAFRRNGQPVIERLSFVQFRGGASGQVDLSSSFLSANEVQQFADMARGPGGGARVQAELGSRYPDSVHAPFRGGPLAKPTTAFSHGTAMLDIVLRGLKNHTRVVGVELPAEVLADASGGALETVVDMAVDTVAQQMIALRGDDTGVVKGTVLLPFAFLGGPHDGSRASIRRLRALIEDYREARVHLRMVLPMGNHLDDRVHARLERAQEGDDRSSVSWRLLPDDHSSNTVELLHEPGEYRMSLFCPDGDGVEIDMSHRDFSLLKRDGGVIGAVWTAERSGWMRTRITLAPTAQRAGRLPLAPAGAWRLSLDVGAGLDAWILRDDATLASRALPPRRQSFFDDPAYRPMHGRVDPVTDDEGPSPAVVRRRGTASLLATGVVSSPTAGIEAVGSQWSRDGRVWLPAVYSGRYRDPPPGVADFPEPTMQPVDLSRPMDGWAAAREHGGRARGMSGNRRFAVSGTSVAAALRARELANEPPVDEGAL